MLCLHGFQTTSGRVRSPGAQQPVFETVAPDAFRARSRRVFYETLPVSVVVHAVVIAAYLTSSIWNVKFPAQSPKLMATYSLTSLPEPPPSPPPPPKGVPHVEAAPAPPPPLAQIVAPTVIPDTIPVVPRTLSALPPPAAVAAAAPSAPEGVPEGDVNGVIGGELGGQLHGVIGGVKFADDGRLHVELGAALPMEPVVQEPPAYPHDMISKGIEDSVIVRYVVGKDGRVKEVSIVDHAALPVFDEATVDAIRRWRFRPMIKNGQRIEVVHELLVNFQLVHGG